MITGNLSCKISPVREAYLLEIFNALEAKSFAPSEREQDNVFSQ